MPKYLSTPERIASELDSIRDRLMTRGIVSGERLYGCDEWSEPVVRLQKVIEALQSPAHDGEVVCIGEVHERGVVWFDQNPHAHPVGTRFYTAPPRVVDVELRKVVAAHIADLRRCVLIYHEHGLHTVGNETSLAADELQAALEKQ